MLFRNLRIPLVVFTVATTVIAGAVSARAALLAYEGWDYTAGGTFNGLNGGFGFSSAWLLNGGAGGANNMVVNAGGFTYTDGNANSLVVVGNRGFVTGDGSATGDNIAGGLSGTSQPLRPFSFNRGTDGSTVSTWISVLALRTGIPNPTPGAPPADYLYGRSAGVQFFYQSTTSTAQGNEQFTMGRGTQSSETATALANDTWSVLQQGNANAVKVSSVDFASPPADFLLIRIDHVGSTVNDLANADTLRMWINPLLDTVPTDASADITLNANEFAAALGINRDLNFNKLRIFAGNAQTTPSGRSYGSLEVDELRVGETFADVTPFTMVPEPSIGVVGGLGLLFFLRRRK
jgi:hypothetical protein